MSWLTVGLVVGVFTVPWVLADKVSSALKRRGRSDRVARGARLERRARVQPARARARGLERPDLVGHGMREGVRAGWESFGGMQRWK